MGWRLKSTGLGTVELFPAVTASNFTMTVPAIKGVALSGDASTGGAYLPVGTTAQRPSSPTTGQVRFNSDLVKLEYWNGTAWIQN
jgi:hypothetical protein